LAVGSFPLSIAIAPSTGYTSGNFLPFMVL
jgi:hypothetical protein